MKVKHLLYSTILISLVAFAGCKNMFNAKDFLSQLEDNVSYENAQVCSFTLKSDSGTGTFVSEGDKTAKVGFDFSLQFNLNTEDYVLHHWGVFNAEDMSEISEALESTIISTEEELERGLYKVNIKFLRQFTNVILKPVCYAIPKAVYINTRDETRADGFTQDTDIIIKFNKPIPEDWFIDYSNPDPEFGKSAKNIEITCKGVDLLKDDQPAVSIQNSSQTIGFFLKPTLSEDGKTLTIATNKCLHILANSDLGITSNNKASFVDDGYADITVKLITTNNSVTVTDDVEGEKIPFQSDITWSYKINNKLDNVPPSILEYDFYKTGNADFTNFENKYEKTLIISSLECVNNKENYLKQRYFVTKKLSVKDSNGNSSVGNYCMFFNVKVQDEGGIQSIATCYRGTATGNSIDQNWSDEVTLKTENINITKEGDNTYIIKGFIDEDSLFDQKSESGFFHIGLVFKDYSGNSSSVIYVPVVFSVNNVAVEDIDIWNEIPTLSDNDGIDTAKSNIETNLKKIYVSVPKKILYTEPNAIDWRDGEPIYEHIYSNYSGKVYYGNSLSTVNNHTTAWKTLEKVAALSTDSVDVFSFEFSTLSLNQDNYINVNFFNDLISNNPDVEITHTFTVPSKYSVTKSGDNLYFSNISTLGTGYGVYVNKFDGTTKTPISAGASATSVSVESYNWQDTSKALVMFGEKSSEGKYLYGMPYVVSSGTSGSSDTTTYTLSFDYNGTAKNYVYDELVVDIEDRKQNSTYLLALQKGSGKTEYFSTFPFVLKNVGEYTYDENGSDVTLTASLWVNGNEATLSKSSIILATDFPHDVTPPTLNKDGKKLSAFPELLYLQNSYDYGSGFDRTDHGFEELACTPWKNKWRTVSDYDGLFNGDDCITIVVKNPCADGEETIPESVLFIDYRFAMPMGKYVIRTNGMVEDKSDNITNAALDYFYFENYLYVQEIGENDLKGVTYSINSDKLKLNAGNLKTGELTNFISQAIPFNKTNNEWDYLKIIDTKTDLTGVFANTFVKCGSMGECTDAGEQRAVYTEPKYYFCNGSSFESTVATKKAQELTDLTVLINSDKPYLVQTYFSEKNLESYSELDLELFTSTINPKISVDTDFYYVDTNIIPDATDIYYRVVIHWADGTSEYCPVHMIKATGSPY